MGGKLTRVSMALATIGLVVGLQAATVGVAQAKSSVFRITKATPDPVNLNVVTIPGTAHVNNTIHWKGKAVFPITANTTPAPGCSTAFFTCNPHSFTFASHKHKLVWSNGWGCSIDAGSSPGSFTGTFYLDLVDAHGQTTPSITVEYTCTWS